ncbi:MAG: hypothetical protein MJY71_06940 [Bacteroidaceae bacterium]|nr:hypothetical protein [Bacteroidaceae bacterium]
MEKENLEYKFIVCNNIAGGYYDFGYKDFQNNASVVYFPTRLSRQKSFLSKLLIRLTFSRKVNRIVKEPFKRYTFKHLFPHDFCREQKICFIFFGCTEEIFQSSYIQYLRATYPKLKIILYMQDIVERNCYLDIKKCRNNFDLLISYDKGDCQKYGMLYYPTPMSYYDIQVQDEKKYDLYFCGKAKTRYELIYQIYNKATLLGLQCDFYLFDMPENSPRINGIHYPTKCFSYEENLRCSRRCKCIVDIMQENADGYTPRVWDSIMNDRHLLTNNASLVDSCYYHPESMHFLNTFLKSNESPEWLNKYVSYSTDFKKQLSPNNLLYFIEHNL